MSPPAPPWLAATLLNLPGLPSPLAAPAALPRELAIPAVAALASWLLLAGLIPALGRWLPDHPNARSAHRRPTPRGGGIAFVLVGTAGCAWLGQGSSAWLPLLCLPLALVGLWDDRVNLPAGLRYGAQLATAIALVAVAQVPIPVVLVPLVLIAVTAVINFVNFMDGLDGLVALCAAVLMAVAGLGPVSGALVGFLAWNWSPARVFMGDVGSTWLGALLAGMVLQQPSGWQGLGLLLVGFPLLADPLVCVLRRWQAGQPVLEAHRLHLFQRLQAAGWSHPRVAALYGLATLALALALVLARRYSSPAPLMLLVGIEMGAAFKLERFCAIPFRDAASRG